MGRSAWRARGSETRCAYATALPGPRPTRASPCCPASPLPWLPWPLSAAGAGACLAGPAPPNGQLSFLPGLSFKSLLAIFTRDVTLPWAQQLLGGFAPLIHSLSLPPPPPALFLHLSSSTVFVTWPKTESDDLCRVPRSLRAPGQPHRPAPCCPRCFPGLCPGQALGLGSRLSPDSRIQRLGPSLSSPPCLWSLSCKKFLTRNFLQEKIPSSLPSAPSFLPSLSFCSF